MAEDATDWRVGETQLTATTNSAEAPADTYDVVPGLTIVTHADARRVGEHVVLPVLALGRSVRLSRLEPLFREPGRGFDEKGQPLAERSMSRQPVRLKGHADGKVTLDRSGTRTPVVADGEPVGECREFSAEDVGRGVVLQVGRRIVLLLHRLRHPAPPDAPPHFHLVGESDAVLRLRGEIQRLASLDVPVLLRGATGTGKELVARALHDAGPRRERPFVAVNMGALNPTLAAAELFGAVRGAYTGADRAKDGYFRGARDGTLFLDEIGEAPTEVQVMLLRALESGEVQPVGSVETHPVNARLIAATDARLEEAITDGRFRAPLYHRLAGYAVQLPPLRERRDDVGRLLRFFLDEELSKLGEADGDEKELWPPPEVVARLARYDWPGNVRELRNVARRLAIAGRDSDTAQLLKSLDDLLAPASPAVAPAPPIPAAPRRASDIPEAEWLEALRVHRWSAKEAAEELGITRPALYMLMKSSSAVRKASDISREEIAARLERGEDVDAMVDDLRISKVALRRRMRQLGFE